MPPKREYDSAGTAERVEITPAEIEEGASQPPGLQAAVKAAAVAVAPAVALSRIKRAAKTRATASAKLHEEMRAAAAKAPGGPGLSVRAIAAAAGMPKSRAHEWLRRDDPPA